MNSLHQVAKGIGILLLATTLVVALAAVLVLALNYILLIFLGILLSVFLTKTSQFTNKYLPIGYGWNLALVTSLLLILLFGSFLFFGNRIHNRLQATSQKLDEGADRLVELLREYPLAMGAFERIPFAEELLLDQSAGGSPSDQSDEPKEAKDKQETSTANRTIDKNGSPDNTSSNSQHSSSTASGKDNGHNAVDESTRVLRSLAGRVFSVLSQIFSTTLGLVVNIGVIFFVGVFIAVEPTLYRDGLARLFPLDRRPRVKDVLDQMSGALYSWLMGRFMTMLITGGGTAAALFALQVPMAVTVGTITGLMTFVPNIGGFIALFLAMLMALPQGLTTVAWVVGLYAALQLLESNVITPLLQQHQTAIPPALLISFQIIMGAIAGFLGLMVATPLLAALMVLIQQAWIKDVLKE